MMKVGRELDAVAEKIMGWMELVRLDRRWRGRAGMRDGPLKREVDAWIEAAKMAHEVGDDESSYQAMVNAGKLLLDAARRDARPLTDRLWDVMLDGAPPSDRPRP